jgi:hypothetical protein
MESAWRIYKPTEAHDVPERPGLYAWYLDFINRQSFIDPEKFLTKYEPYLKAFSSDREDEQTDPVGGSYLAHLVGSGRFGDAYSAQLRVENKLIGKDSKADRKSPEAASREGAQEILRTLFNEGFQILSAPIYVGKSDNLSRRIEEHLTAIDDARAVAGKFGGDWYVANDPPRTFARRFVGLGLNPSMLLFACIAIDPTEIKMNPAAAMYWIEEAEYYFNNISRPSLGRK